MKSSFPRGGYHKRLLRVNLTTREITAEDIPIRIITHFLGGTGLAAYYLYTEVPEGADPLGSENRLIFATGPLTGSLIPGTGTYTVMCKSPLTGYAAAAQASGFFGARLKAAGFDAILFHGKSEKKVYLYIDSTAAKLQSAQFLDNKGAFDTELRLRSRHDEKGFEDQLSVACIGPAGENQVRFAAISSDRGHMAASGGVGAVMGSKNLKAIVVCGDGAVPTISGKKAQIKKAIRQWRKESGETGLGRTVHNRGTLGLFKPYQAMSWVPVKNLTTNYISEEDLEKYDWEFIREEVYEKIPRSCYACTFKHCNAVKVMKGPSSGFIGEEIEFEILAGYGANWGISDPGTITMLNGLVDDKGMDAKELSFLLSMLMEACEKGLINCENLDGIDLQWGNVEAIKQIIERISRREGIGNLLAEGIYRSALALGEEVNKLGVYVKQGNAPHIHDCRTRWGALFTQATSNTTSLEGMDMTSRANPELGIDRPTSEPDSYVAEVQSKTGPKRQFEECLSFCYFQACSFKQMVQTLNLLTGGHFRRSDCLKIGERVINLLRLFSIREGHQHSNDSYSYRLGQCPTDGRGKGKSMDPHFEEIKKNYYQLMGWDETGVPTATTLKRLNLDQLAKFQ